MKKITISSPVRPVRLPVGKLCAQVLCGECLWLDLKDKNSDGNYYCAKDRRYYPATHSGYCSDYQEK